MDTFKDIQKEAAMSDTDLASKLMKIVPTWQHVDTTKAGYNEQYIKTIMKLVDFVKENK